MNTRSAPVGARWAARSAARRAPLRRAHALVACAALAGVTGCGWGDGPDRVVVDGSVVFDGAPVANGQIYFYPTEENPGPVSGASIKDGAYVARARGGVPVGKHRVEITAYRPAKGASREASEGLPAYQYLPDKFNRRTELTAVVEPSGGRQTLDFNLMSN